MTQPDTTPDPDAIVARALEEIDGIAADTAADFARIMAEVDAAAVRAHDEATAAASDARTVASDDFSFLRAEIDAVPGLDLLTAAAPTLGAYLTAARSHLAAAAKDPAFKKVLALIGRLPEDRARRMVERLAIRAYAQGNDTARNFLRDLVALTKSTKPVALEQQVEVALQRHYGECVADQRDLDDVVRAVPPPGRALVPADAATVQLDRVPADARRRVRGLGGAR